MKNDKTMTKKWQKNHEPEKKWKLLKTLGFYHFFVIFLSFSYHFLQFLMLFFNFSKFSLIF